MIDDAPFMSTTNNFELIQIHNTLCLEVISACRYLRAVDAADRPEAQARLAKAQAAAAAMVARYPWLANND